MNIVASPLCLCLAGMLLCPVAEAQILTARSSSGQFVARQKEGQTAPFRPDGMARIAGGWTYLLTSNPTAASSNADSVTLDAATLVVSCERLKSMLLTELELSDQWQGRIDLYINPSLPENKGPLLTGVYDPNGWNYQLELPKTLSREILMRTVVQTMLQEIANRQAGSQSAEVPLWLVEGMSANLQANNLPTYILQSGDHFSGEVKWNKGAGLMPAELKKGAALTFQQLSWPQAADLKPEGLPLYRDSARLFLEALLRLPDGKACLRGMLAQLAHHWNWQTGFLVAFHPHFKQLLDVEKWWGLKCVDFARGQTSESWSDNDCWRYLKDSLDVPVDVHFDPARLPAEARITLQEAIRQWPPADSYRAVERAVNGLRYMVSRATPRYRPIAGLYLKTLAVFMNGSQAAERPANLGKNSPERSDGVRTEVIKQLDALDRERFGMKFAAPSTNLSKLTR